MPFAARTPLGPSCSLHMLGSAVLPGILTERSPPTLFKHGHIQSSHPMHKTNGGGSGGEFMCAACPQYTST